MIHPCAGRGCATSLHRRFWTWDPGTFNLCTSYLALHCHLHKKPASLNIALNPVDLPSKQTQYFQIDSIRTKLNSALWVRCMGGGVDIHLTTELSCGRVKETVLLNSVLSYCVLTECTHKPLFWPPRWPRNDSPSPPAAMRTRDTRIFIPTHHQ